MEIVRKEISKQDFETGRMPSASNFIMVEVESGEKKTSGGIVIGFNDEVQYAEGNENHIADVATIHGKVVKKPANLNLNHNGVNCPPWDTEMEIEIGDEVWFNTLVATNCTELTMEGRVFKLIPYGDLFVAKREMKGVYNTVVYNGREYLSGSDPYTEVICLNGYCLVEKVEKKSLGSLDLLSEQNIDLTRGVIRYMGSKNKSYHNKFYSDDIDVQIGDEVLFTDDNYPIPLERFKYNATFDNGKMYFATQRRFMAAVLSQNN
jgi:co-chaperonin GroES (HSP10)